MTRPLPHDRSNDPEELRRQWLLRYIRIQTRYDTRVKTILIASAQDAFDRIESLASKETFSAKVRGAQIRMVMKELSPIMRDLFGEILPVIRDGQKEAARQAVEAFAATDRVYLRSAFSNIGHVDSFVSGQKHSAAIGIANAISRVTKSDIPLSGKVYRSRALATGWVQRQVTSGILRGDSAQDIAKQVRSSIRPSTPGGVSYAALRLGRTELNNAFHATAITLAQDRPWVEGMQWHLSKTHEFESQSIPEICERYAGQIFQVDVVPSKPHPQCRCFVTPQLEPFDVFVRHLTAGQYRSWIEDAA